MEVDAGKPLGVDQCYTNNTRTKEDVEATHGWSAEPDGDADSYSGLSKARLITLVLTVTGAAFLNTFQVQAIVIILPTIGDDLDIPDSRLQWLVSGYSLTFGCFLLLWGRLADVYGKKLIFVWGSAWVTATTVAAPFVRNEIGFNTLRGLQGLGGAANVPTALGILGVTFAPGKAKNYAFSCYGAGAPLGGIIGNIIGGIIGQYLSWEWIFWILAILAALVTIAGYFVIPSPPVVESTAGFKSAVDWIGGTLVTVGLIALMFALTEGNVVGWDTPWVPALIAVSVVLVTLFAFWQWYLESKTTRRPLMKISVFKNAQFSAAMLIMGLFFAAFSNFLVFSSYYYQDYQGQSVIQTTLRFIPTGICGIFVAFATAKLLGRVKGIYILLFGTLSVTLCCLLMAAPIPPTTTYWAYGFPAMVLSVCGADTIYPTLTLFTAHSLPQEDQALGGALINAVGQLGRAIGLAVATAVQTAVIAADKGSDIKSVGTTKLPIGDASLLKGLFAANWVGFGLSVVSILLVVFAFRGAGVLGAKH